MIDFMNPMANRPTKAVSTPPMRTPREEEEYYSGLMAAKKRKKEYEQMMKEDSFRETYKDDVEAGRMTEQGVEDRIAGKKPGNSFTPTVDPMEEVTWKPEPWRTNYPDGTPIPGARRPLSMIVPVDKTPQQMQQELVDAEKARRKRAMREALGYSQV